MAEFNSGRNDGGCFLLRVLSGNFFNFIQKFFCEFLNAEKNMYDWQAQPEFVVEKLTRDSVLDLMREKFDLPLFDSRRWYEKSEHRLDWLANQIADNNFGTFEEINAMYQNEWEQIRFSYSRQISTIMNE